MASLSGGVDGDGASNLSKSMRVGGGETVTQLKKDLAKARTEVANLKSQIAKEKTEFEKKDNFRQCEMKISENKIKTYQEKLV